MADTNNQLAGQHENTAKLVFWKVCGKMLLVSKYTTMINLAPENKSSL